MGGEGSRGNNNKKLRILLDIQCFHCFRVVVVFPKRGRFLPYDRISAVFWVSRNSQNYPQISK
jgi:hypothetical protein